ncbi:MAG: hypothetical protein DMF25_09605 [Verrucomicrobia bacterium]|nr:MAG: hypothetical protein DMF25_09605 [Verrucomicrobiota bacterium]
MISPVGTISRDSRRIAGNGKTAPSGQLQVCRKGSCVTIEFDGDGFLYKMVRLIVGSLVRCALGKLSIEEIAGRLASGRPGGARFAAPAEGLFLVRVRY